MLLTFLPFCAFNGGMTFILSVAAGVTLGIFLFNWINLFFAWLKEVDES